MGRFFDWLAKPMTQEDIVAWYMANNINNELSDLFRDFCLSFLSLLNDTYLGEDYNENKETKVGMTQQQKKEHFQWCWKHIIKNFQKENINFEFIDGDYEFFENFFFEIFYSNTDKKIKDSMYTFFKQIFDTKHKRTKSDIEIFTDLYKLLERSLKNKNSYLQN